MAGSTCRTEDCQLSHREPGMSQEASSSSLVPAHCFSSTQAPHPLLDQPPVQEMRHLKPTQSQ